MHTRSFIRLFRPFVALLCLGLCSLLNAAADRRSFAVPAGPAEKSLKVFAEQSGAGLLVTSDVAKGVTTREVRGEYTPREALDRMLQDTGLVASQDPKNGAFMVKKEVPIDPNANRAIAQNSGRPSKNQQTEENADGEKVLKLETFEVMGSKLLNMDVVRTRNDAQPYVILDRHAIERSGAINLNDFLKNNLPQNTTSGTSGQKLGASNIDNSAINLRGLGTNQTLILIDGRRVASGFSATGSISQPDVSAIPLAAVERIDILPTTASGVYGGGATGGVINIILRHDYSGAELRATYDNVFNGDHSIKSISLAAGMNLESGRTNLLISANYMTAPPLTIAERDFYARGRDLILQANPTSSIFFSSSPPLGSTPNIRSSDGSSLSLKSGQALNSAFTYVPVGYSGVSSDAGAGLVANAGHYNLDVSSSSLATSRAAGGLSLLNGYTQKSIAATIRRQTGTRLQLFADVAASEKTAFFPETLAGLSAYVLSPALDSNPFQQTIRVMVPVIQNDGISSRTKNIRFAAGAIIRLTMNWSAEADVTWTQQSSSFSFPAFPSQPAFDAAVNAGSINVVRDVARYPIDLSQYGPFRGNHTLEVPRDTLTDYSLRAAGPLTHLRHADISLVSQLEHRDERMSAGSYGVDTTPNLLVQSRSQQSDSAYVEARAPIVTQEDNYKGVNALTLSASLRAERTATDGVTPTNTSTSITSRATNAVSSIDPTFAVIYSPVKALKIRCSYGTGFLPPSVNQLVSSLPATRSATFVDPLRGNLSQTLPITFIDGGGNKSLNPEKSTSWSAGLIYEPQQISGLRLSIDYLRIDKKDNIVNLTLDQTLANESVLPGRVIRSANLPGDQAGWGGPVNSVDLSATNISRAKVEAYDTALDYELKFAGSRSLVISAIATWQTHYLTQIVPSTPFVENVNVTDANPLKFKAVGGVSYKQSQWELGWRMRYFDGYWLNAAHTLDVNQGSNGIPSQRYHDLYFTYNFKSSGGTYRRLLQGLSITSGVRNVFNTYPPVVASSTFLYSPYGDPRLSSYYISIRKVL